MSLSKKNKKELSSLRFIPINWSPKRHSILFLSLFTLILNSFSQPPTTYTNPILPGSHPDPSICRVGDTYYIVNSSFIWFPGVPIHKSKDLVNWELIGHALNTPEHLDINNSTGVHGGIWAPTLRYNNGTFYLTVTQKRCGTSIVTTAQNPEGPWSVPVTLHNEKGIDGSLFFDKDQTWYCWSQDHLILMREFDKQKLELKGDTILLLNEQMFGNNYSHIEGPHIYKLTNGEYMLLIASGGTGTNNHNISVFKSAKPQGPYIPCPNNPVLTHRGTKSNFNNIGHADIVETQNGEWYAVMLGVRPKEGLTIMDRETFMTKFVWRDGWPVFNPDANSMVLASDIRPNLPWHPITKQPTTDSFNNKELNNQFNFYHTPHKTWWSLSDHPGFLRIYTQKDATTSQTNTPIIARRITQFDFNASTKVFFNPKEDDTAGLIALMNQNGQMRLELFSKDGVVHARVVTYMKGRKVPLIETVSNPVQIKDTSVVMQLKARGLKYQFYIGSNNNDLRPIGKELHGEIISRQKIGSYSGAYVGVFSSSNGTTSNNHADFDWFTYKTEGLGTN